MSETAFNPEINPEFAIGQVAGEFHSTMTQTLRKRGSIEADGYYFPILFETNKYAVVSNYFTSFSHKNYSNYERAQAYRESLEVGNPILSIEIHQPDQEIQSYVVCQPANIRAGSMLHSMLKFSQAIDFESQEYVIAGLGSQEIDLHQFQTILQQIN
jgi:hypothetical protein